MYCKHTISCSQTTIKLVESLKSSIKKSIVTGFPQPHFRREHLFMRILFCVAHAPTKPPKNNKYTEDNIIYGNRSTYNNFSFCCLLLVSERRARRRRTPCMPWMALIHPSDAFISDARPHHLSSGALFLLPFSDFPSRHRPGEFDILLPRRYHCHSVNTCKGGTSSHLNARGVL